MLVGGAQTTLTVRAIVRADRRDDPREAWGPQGATQSRPPEALDRCTGVTGAVGTARNTRHPPYLCIHELRREGVNSTSPPPWITKQNPSTRVPSLLRPYFQ